MHVSQIGLRGENIAEKFLLQKGYKILFRNFQTKYGEIDIVAQENGTLVFVEVKTRSNVLFGQPFEAVNFKKLEKINKAAQIFSGTHKNLPEKWRIDVVSLILSDPSDNAYDVELLKDVC